MSEAESPRAAYFSMEIALEAAIPTYSGGLGMLAGDTLRSASDLAVPMVAVTLLYRRGYFHQRLDERGQQTEEPTEWRVEDWLEPLAARAEVEIAGRSVRLGVWRYVVKGAGGASVPVYLLDADLPENDPADRALTAELYGGDAQHRLAQEIILGIGGLRMLRSLGHDGIGIFHMNEGHAALSMLALLEEFEAAAAPGKESDSEILLGLLRPRCVFTTHTPVPAGHDRFPADLVDRLLGPAWRKRLALCGQKDSLNMTQLAIAGSAFVNGVALKHGEVSRAMFPGVDVRSITNGVHAATWASAPFQRVFDRWAPGWRLDNSALRNVIGASLEEIWTAHLECKQALVDFLSERGHKGFDRDALTLVWARRATGYKRPQLFFESLDRLKSMTRYIGPLQIIFAGKAHPRDDEGKALIRSIHEIAGQLKGKVPVAYVENYDMAVARKLVAGADVWVNTPRPPMEASGTSGMKAAMNGVPSLSVLDGWWIEGHIEGGTGWAVGEYVADAENPENDRKVAHALYEKLAKVVLPCYFKDRDEFIAIMRRTVAFTGSFFNTHRMVEEYLLNAYRLQGGWKPREG